MVDLSPQEKVGQNGEEFIEPPAPMSQLGVSGSPLGRMLTPGADTDQKSSRR
jgi:hypothetical protein